MITRLLVATTALALTTFTAAAQTREAKITFFIWAGSNQGVVPQEVFKAYREKHPKVEIEVLESNNMITFPKMVATKRTTPDRPLVHCGFFNVDSITKGDVEDMWAKLDPARVPNMNNVLKDFVRPEGRGVGYMMSAIGILYNKNAVKEPPTSWADLWAPANRGRVTMFDYDARMVAIAARLNGGSEKSPEPGLQGLVGQCPEPARAGRLQRCGEEPGQSRATPGWRRGSRPSPRSGSRRARRSGSRSRRKARSHSRCSSPWSTASRRRSRRCART